MKLSKIYLLNMFMLLVPVSNWAQESTFVDAQTGSTFSLPQGWVSASHYDDESQHQVSYSNKKCTLIVTYYTKINTIDKEHLNGGGIVTNATEKGVDADLQVVKYDANLKNVIMHHILIGAPIRHGMLLFEILATDDFNVEIDPVYKCIMGSLRTKK
jgi:hypothetical protein